MKRIFMATIVLLALTATLAVLVQDIEALEPPVLRPETDINERGIIIYWKGARFDVVQFLIYRGPTVDMLEMIGEVIAERGEDDYLYIDESPPTVGSFVYVVSAVDEGGNESFSGATIPRVALGPAPEPIRLGRARGCSVKFSSDSKQLAIGGELYDVTVFPPRFLKSMSGGGLVYFSPDRKIAISFGVEEVNLWDPEREEHIATFPGYFGIQLAVLSPDGTMIAIAGGITGGNEVSVWDVATQERLALFREENTSSTPCSIAFSPNSKVLAAGVGGQIKVYNIAIQELVAVLEGRGQHVAFSGDGKALMATSGKKLKLWDLETQECLATLEGHNYYIDHLVVLPDNKTVATATGAIYYPGEIKLWDITTQECIAAFDGHNHGITALDFSPDGASMVSASCDGRVLLWDVKSGAVIYNFQEGVGGVTAVTFVSDRILASAHGPYESGTARLWDIETQEEIATFAGGAPIAVSPDGKVLASAWYRVIFLWDIGAKKLVGFLWGHTDEVTALSFSPDNKTLASGSKDKTVKLWDISTRECIATLEGHEEGITSLAFAPNGRLLASGAAFEAVGDPIESSIKLWDLGTKESISLAYPDSKIEAIAFSQDGDMLISKEGDTVRYRRVLWDEEGGNFVDISSNDCFKGFDQLKAHVAAISPSAEALAFIGLVDSKISLWKLNPERPRFLGYLSVQVPAGGTCLSFSPDGALIAVGLGGGTILIQETTSPVPPVPQEVSTEISEGGKVPSDEIIVVKFKQEMGSVVITVFGAEGTTNFPIWGFDGCNYKEAQWVSTEGIMPLGPHTLTVEGIDRRGWELERLAIHFTSVAPQRWLRIVSSNPEDGSRNVDVRRYEQLQIGFSRAMAEAPVVSIEPPIDPIPILELREGGKALFLKLPEGHRMSKGVSYKFALSGKALYSEEAITLEYSFTTQANKLPTAGLDLSQRFPITGIPVIFEGTSSGDPDGEIVSYQWDFGDGTTGSGKVVVHAYASKGSYEVELTVTDDDGATATATVTITVLPAVTAVLQNYPNPFNPETWIPYQLAEESEVTIRIFTASGKLAKSLELGYRQAGGYLTPGKAAYWDGCNEAGERVASGVYFYTLQAGKSTETRKMIILK